MSIFSKPNKLSGGGATIIAKGTKVRGEMDLECTLHIDGVFDGIIHSKSMVTIGKSGVVNGEIYANKVIVNGAFSGMVDSEFIEILAEGKVTGKVVAKEFMIEKRGVFEGESRVKHIETNSIKQVKTIKKEKLEYLKESKDDIQSLKDELELNVKTK